MRYRALHFTRMRLNLEIAALLKQSDSFLKNISSQLDVVLKILLCLLHFCQFVGKYYRQR